MRIAFVDMLFTWPPDGGARTDIREVAVRLARDHEVTIFCPHNQDMFPRGVVSGPLPGIRVERIPFTYYQLNRWDVMDRFKKALREYAPDRLFISDSWYFKPHLYEALAEFRPILRFYAYESICPKRGILWRFRRICRADYLGCRWPGIVRCILCAAAGVRLRADEQHGHEFYGALAFLPSYRRRVLNMLRGASAVIVYNDFIGDRIRRYNPNVILIPSGVDPERFTETGSRAQDDDIRTILMVGRISDDIKGFYTLYQAAHRLRKKRKDFRLLVTVDMAGTEFTEDYIEGTGWLTQDQLAVVYEQADICVVPSKWAEPFGIVALEAMSAGKPVIATRVGGLQHIVRHGETGFLVQPRKVDELAERLDILLDDHQLRNRMGHAGREVVRREYTWDIIVDRYYRPLVQSGAALEPAS